MGCISCDRNAQDQTYIIVIKNELDQDINIKSFRSAEKLLIKSIRIETKNEFIAQFESDERRGPHGAKDIFEGDFVAIQIGTDLKFITYLCNRSLDFEESGCDIGGNILNDGGSKWKRAELSENVFVNTYTCE